MTISEAWACRHSGLTYSEVLGLLEAQRGRVRHQDEMVLQRVYGLKEVLQYMKHGEPR